MHDFDLSNSTDPVLQDNLAFTAEPIIASAIGWPQPIINNSALTPVRLAENTNVMSFENPTKLANMMQESHIIPDQVEQASHNGDCNNDKMVFDYSKTLSIAQCPMEKSNIKKTPNKEEENLSLLRQEKKLRLVYNQLLRILFLHTKEA